MNNVAEKVPYQDCCGCGACLNACPKGAISMIENSEGFLVPSVDSSLCIDCSLCLKACPALNEKRATNPEPECYAAQAHDDIRSISSSGGIFTPLAEAILNRGGLVCGAAFRNDWTVHHIIVDQKEDLAKLRGSKYVQSDTEDCYKRIKALLKDGKWVLFSGTPCQVAGLYTYLGKDYDTLLTVDIFCHGAPSPGVWKRYLRENYEPGSIANVNFRDKKAIGWSCSHVAITLKNGKKEVSDNYTKWFHSSIILRPSCENCKHNKLPRPGDISLGDWWGISQIDPKLNDGKGLSNVLINTPKGKALYESVSIAKSTPVVLPKDYNNSFMRFGMRKAAERDNFFADNMPLNTNKKVENSLKRHYDICFLSTFYADNYGAILVAYSAYKIMEKMGYSILPLNCPKCVWNGQCNELNYIISLGFAHRHYPHISPHYAEIDDLAHTNNYCDSYVVGSDQLFKPVLDLDAYSYLPFARKDKLKIAFATSFGDESYRCGYERMHKNKQLLQQFDRMALRETPQNLVENVFELDAVEVIDPTLIVPSEEFYKLAKEAQNLDTSEPYLLTYTLDPNPAKENAISYIADKLGLKVIYIPDLYKRRLHRTKNIPYPSKFQIVKDYSPEEFCKLYRDATFVVTDSYHGTCFSIIFRKPFVSIINVGRGKVRYKMFDSFGIKHRFYASPEEVYRTNAWMEPIDYSIAEKVIKQKAQFACKWLEKALRPLKWKKRTRWMREKIAYPVRDFFRALRKKNKKD